jgi:hypothetical protein
VSLGLIVIFYLNTQPARSFHVGHGFFFFFNRGGRATPIGHGGGSATPDRTRCVFNRSVFKIKLQNNNNILMGQNGGS